MTDAIIVTGMHKPNKLYAECNHCPVQLPCDDDYLPEEEPERERLRRAFFLRVARHVSDEHGIMEPSIKTRW